MQYSVLVCKFEHIRKPETLHILFIVLLLEYIDCSGLLYVCVASKQENTNEKAGEAVDVLY